MLTPMIPNNEQIQIESANVQPEDDEPNTNYLLLLYRILRGHHKAIILTAIILSSIFSITGYLLVKPKYSAMGIVRVAPSTPMILYKNKKNTTIPLYDSFVSAQATYLLSQPVLERASYELSTKKIAWPTGYSGTKLLENKLKITTKRRNELIMLSSTHTSPRTAYLMVNSVLQSYETLHGEKANHTASIKERALETRLIELEQKLSENNKKIMNTLGQYTLSSLKKTHDYKIQQIQYHEEKITEITNMINNEGDFNNGLNLENSNENNIAKLTIYDHAMSIMLSRYATIKSQHTAASARLGKKHHVVVSYQHHLNVLGNSIENRRQQLIALAKTGQLQKAHENNQEENTQKYKLALLKHKSILSKLTSESTELNKKYFYASQLYNTRLYSQQAYDETLTRIEQTRLETENSLPGRIEIAVWASESEIPSTDKRLAASFIGIIAGVITSVLSFVAQGLLQRKCRYSDEVDTFESNGQLIGTLPHITNNLTQRLYANSIYHIRNELDLRWIQCEKHLCNITLITGAGRNTGKTKIAKELCKSFSYEGDEILYINFDSHNVIQANIINTPGICEILNDTNKTIPYKTEIDHLYFLPLGNVDQKYYNQTSYQHLQNIFNQLRQDFDHIFVDMGDSNCNVITDLLSKVSDNIIFIINANQSMAYIKSTVNIFNEKTCQSKSFIFNNSLETDLGLIYEQKQA